MPNVAMLLVYAVVLGMVIVGVGGFFLVKFSKDTIDKDLNRLNKETEVVRSKQTELNAKIKEANEELSKRKSEADALVLKMREDAEAKAKEERDKILVKARQEGEEIIVKANRTKDDIRKSLTKEFDMKAVDFTGILLGRILSNKGKEALDECLGTEFLENLKKVDMEMIGEDITTAEVTTAVTLSESLKNRLSDLLSQKLNRVIQIKTNLDESVISGMVLRFGSLVLDGSLLNMIKETSIEIKDKIEKGLLESK